MRDEDLYALALEEFERQPEKGFLGKALVRADGNDARVKSEYIKLRVEDLKAERGSEARARDGASDGTNSQASYRAEDWHAVIKGITIFLAGFILIVVLADLVR